MKKPKKPKKTKKKVSASQDLPGSKTNLTFKKNFLPLLAGLFVFLLVFGFFNSEPLSARIAYFVYSRQNQSTLSEPVPVPVVAGVIDKNAPSIITIDTINVSAPVVHDQTVVDEDAFQIALQNGVVHYPATAKPGEKGNVVLFGHSSSPWWAKGDYKFVFTLLDQLEVDDLVSVDYEGVRYTYKVKNVFVTVPSDTTVLNQGEAHTLTLITCSPVGSNTKRLIIQAEQIQPAVGRSLESTAEVVSPESLSDQALPGASSGFWSNFLELFRG